MGSCSFGKSNKNLEEIPILQLQYSRQALIKIPDRSSGI